MYSFFNSLEHFKTVLFYQVLNYNYNVIMQGINFNQRPTSIARWVSQSHTQHGEFM